MKKIMTNYSGAILLYSVIVLGVLVLNARFKYLNAMEGESETSSIVAMGDVR